MRSTELAVPAENTVRALRRLAPGARLRTPRTPELRVIAAALRECAPPELARVHPGPVAGVVLAAQLRALDRAMTGFFAAGVPESARLVRAARFGRVRPDRRLRDRLDTEPGLRTAALAWAEALGHRILAGELRGVREVPEEEDGRLAAELAVAELLPRAEAGTGGREVLLPWPDGGPGPAGGGSVGSVGSGPLGVPPGAGGGSGGGSAGLAPGSGGSGPLSAGGGSVGSLGSGPLGVPPGAGAGAGGGAAGPPSGSGETGPPSGGAGAAAGPPPNGGAGEGGRADPGPAPRPPADPGGSAFLHVRSVRVTDHGFQVDVHADPPIELLRDGDGLTLRALWWNGLGRITDDLGHEYLLLAKDQAGTGTVRHWCHPRLAPGASVLRLESAGYRGERVRLEPAAAGSCAEVLVKLELTVRLGV
ncbi:hypothetical protein ILP97_22910 [Amycolatopsis sp. H6(2020)]|nr:hypothetical protein [Amycolatopsis sp. H6(2020)]